MIKAILLDIGGVLYLGKNEDFYSKLDECFHLKKGFMEDFFGQYQDALLVGKISSSKFFGMVNNALATKHSQKEIKTAVEKAWFATMVMNKDLERTVQKLRTKYKIGCLSNATKFDVEMDKITGIKRLFDVYLNSCDTGITKSDIDFYKIALRKLKCKPEECLYVDDREKYVKISSQLGMKSILFVGNKELFREWKELGIES